MDANEEEQSNSQNDSVNTEESASLLPTNTTQNQSQTSPTTSTTSPKRKKTTPKKSPAKNFRKKGITPFQSALLQKLDTSDGKDNSAARKLEDPDRMFLLSLLGDYKKLNDDEKLDFKLEVLQFFKRHRHPPSNFHNLLQVNYDSSSPAASSQSDSRYAASPPDSYGQSNFQFFQHSAPAPLHNNMTPLSNTLSDSRISNLSITVPYSTEASHDVPVPTLNPQPHTY